MELARLDKVKSTLTSELTRLSAEAEKCETLTIEHEELQELYQETEAKYQTMLTVNLIHSSAQYPFLGIFVQNCKI